MKGTISANQLTLLTHVLSVCKEIGMDSAIIHGGRIMASAADQSSVIVHQFDEALITNPPGLDPRLGVTRIPIFASRLALIEGRSADVSLTLSDKKPYYTVLNATTPTHTVEFRFADPDFLDGKVPKGIKGAATHTLTLTQSQIKQLVEVSRSFQPERIWTYITPTGARFEMTDIAAGDRASVQLTDKEEVTTTIAFMYDAGTLLRLLNQKNGDVAISIFNNGLLRVMYKDISVYVLRKETSR